MKQENISQIKLTRTQRIRLAVFGITPTEKKARPGWNGELQFYAFNCPEHGLVEDYPHGFNQTLRCPVCTTEHRL